MPRTKPYTTIGIARLPCARCGCRPSAYQWQVCADNRIFRTICALCDVELNELVIRFVWGDTREDDLARYRKEKLGC